MHTNDPIAQPSNDKESLGDLPRERIFATAEDFDFCYRVFLFRTPEIDKAELARNPKPLIDVVKDFLNSVEFRFRVVDPARLNNGEPAWSSTAISGVEASTVPALLDVNLNDLATAESWAEYFDILFGSSEAQSILRSALGDETAVQFRRAIRSALNLAATDRELLRTALAVPSGRTKLAGTALYQLERSDDQNGTYIVTGDDPQMLLADEISGDLINLLPGIHQILFVAKAYEGRIQAPVIYVDTGNGFSEADGSKFNFIRLSEDEWCCNVVAEKEILKIRLDPTEVGCTFAILQLEIIKISSSTQLVGFSKRSKANASDWAAAESPWKKLEAQETEYRSGFWSRVSISQGERDKAYAALSADPVAPNPQNVKILAYYLTQFHPIPENDKWWGPGFTEWTNVAKANPQYVGHYQPRLPGELGYYDLRVPEVMARQIELAKIYGIGGFCYYYYWFDGKRLLEKPLDMFLSREDTAFDFPFCLCWANENWTRRWDGAEADVLMKQSHSTEDHRAVIRDLMRYVVDRRYITVEGKPMILIYRPDIIDNIREMVTIWREEAAIAGLPGLHLVATNSFGFDNPDAFGLDAICEFPPHGLDATQINNQVPWYNPHHQGDVFDYAGAVEFACNRMASRDFGSNRPRYPGAMTSWDNEARKPTRGNVFHGSTPAIFRHWVAEAVNYVINNNNQSERFVFINAWNEWAEGAYLEPDRKFGYAYLAAAASPLRALLTRRTDLAPISELVNTTADKSSDTVVCLHIFYEDLIEEFAQVIREARIERPLDVIVTVPETWQPKSLQRLVDEIEPTRVIICENIGRDVAPFLRSLHVARSMGYTFGCKVHSKKSVHLTDGARWRSELVMGLLSTSAFETLRPTFFCDSSIGLAAPLRSFATLKEEFAIRDNLEKMNAILARLGNTTPDHREFIAGTMFWFRFDAMAKFDSLEMEASDFDAEMGQIDATIAHAFERIFVTSLEADGWRIFNYELDKRPAAVSLIDARR
jgi:lipopolysaccharide biosynthesis protein